jgi:hypothetical protein
MALEALWRVVTDGQNAVDDGLAERGGWGFARARLTVEDGFVIWRCRAQAFEPLFDPAERVSDGIGEILAGPLRPADEQGAQAAPVRNPLSFHHAPPTTRENTRKRVYTWRRRQAMMSLP